MRNDLARVDAALAKVRAQGLARFSGRRRRRAHLARDPGTVRLSKLERAIDRARTRQIIQRWKRDERLDRNRADLQQGADSDLHRFDAFIAGLHVQAKAGRFQIDARIRALLAQKYRAVARSCERDDLITRAEKLEHAGREGWWGKREADGSIVIRLRDRSGLIKDDPAESRERTAELIDRLLPLALVCASKKYELHYCVFTEPNIPAGSLAWGKEHLFRQFCRVILERDTKGQEKPRTIGVRHQGRTFEIPNLSRKLPEIVGAFAVQEDPLAIDAHHWNTHLNVVLVVDPGQCEPLDKEFWPIDPQTGEPKPDPAAAVDGMFSYMKLAHVWGHNVEARWLRPRASALRDALLEVIKYSCKTVSEKSLEKFGPVQHSSPASEPAVPFELTSDELADPQAAARHTAPAMIDWPDARVVEWIDANQGFRRVRSWGCLYRLGTLERASDPDEGIRWLGRLWVSPWKVTVQSDFFGEGSLSVDWIRENKSPAHFPAHRAQGPPPSCTPAVH